MIRRVSFLTKLVLLTWLAWSPWWCTSAQQWAYRSASLSGNYQWNGNLGLDFDVREPIYVFQLGAFNANAVLAVCIDVGIFSRVTRALVGATRLRLCASNTSQDGVISYAALPSPVLLTPGPYSVVAYGYIEGSSLQYFDIGAPGAYPYGTAAYMNGNGCDPSSSARVINFVGLSRYNNDCVLSYPELLDDGPIARYAAGTFSFAAVFCHFLWLSADDGVGGTVVPPGNVQVTSWASRQGAASVAAGFSRAAGPQVVQRAGLRSFHAGVVFDGTGVLSGALPAPVATPMIFAVFTGGVVPEAGSNVLSCAPSGSFGVYYDGRVGADATPPCVAAANVSTVRPTLVRVSYTSPTAVTVHVGAVAQPACGAITLAGPAQVALEVGGKTLSNPGAIFRGTVYELLLFPTSSEILLPVALESYLALKYGLCLGGATNYVDSLGSVVFSNTAPYDRSILALGRHLVTRLDQRVSFGSGCSDASNDAATSVLGLATSNEFTAANGDAPRPSLAAGETFVCGSDGGALSFGGAWGAPSNRPLWVGRQLVRSRLRRVWRCDFVAPATRLYVCVSSAVLEPRSEFADDSALRNRTLFLLIDYSTPTFTSPVGRGSLEAVPLVLDAAGCWTNASGFTVAPSAGSRGQLFVGVAIGSDATPTRSGSPSGMATTTHSFELSGTVSRSRYSVAETASITLTLWVSVSITAVLHTDSVLPSLSGSNRRSVSQTVSSRSFCLKSTTASAVSGTGNTSSVSVTPTRHMYTATGTVLETQTSRFLTASPTFLQLLSTSDILVELASGTGAASSGFVVAASFLGVPSSGDVGSLAALGLMVCAPAALRKTVGPMRYALSPAVDFGGAAMVAANVGIAMACLVFQVLLTTFVFRLTRTELTRYPHLSMVLLLLCFPGIACGCLLCVAELADDKNRSEQQVPGKQTLNVVAILLTLLLTIVVGASYWLIARGCRRRALYYKRRSSSSSSRSACCAGYVFQPQGAWQPKTFADRFGFGFSMVHGRKHVHFPLALWVHNVSFLCMTRISFGNCTVQFAVLAAFKFALASVVIVRRPFRARIDTVLESCIQLLMSLLLISMAIATTDGPRHIALDDSISLLSVLQGLATILRTANACLIAFLEGRTADGAELTSSAAVKEEGGTLVGERLLVHSSTGRITGSHERPQRRLSFNVRELFRASLRSHAQDIVEDSKPQEVLLNCEMVSAACSEFGERRDDQGGASEHRTYGADEDVDDWTLHCMFWDHSGRSLVGHNGNVDAQAVVNELPLQMACDSRDPLLLGSIM